MVTRFLRFINKTREVEKLKIISEMIKDDENLNLDEKLALQEYCFNKYNNEVAYAANAKINGEEIIKENKLLIIEVKELKAKNKELMNQVLHYENELFNNGMRK